MEGETTDDARMTRGGGMLAMATTLGLVAPALAQTGFPSGPMRIICPAQANERPSRSVQVYPHTYACLCGTTRLHHLLRHPQATLGRTTFQGTDGR